MTQALEDEKSQLSLMDNIILGVAHELNNPNAFIRVNAMNLKKMLALLHPSIEEYQVHHPDAKFGPYKPEDLFNKMIELNESILGATIRIITISDKLKQCTSFSMSATENISMVEVIKNIISMHQFLIDKLGEFKFVYDEKNKYNASVHTLQLEQAISILLTNACDALDERHKDKMGKESKLSITLDESEDLIIITVQDNATGMSEDTIKKIFTPYFTTKPQGVGDGLGLPICKSIIQRHGGNIEVISKVGEGTKFVISLPKNA